MGERSTRRLRRPKRADEHDRASRTHEPPAAGVPARRCWTPPRGLVEERGTESLTMRSPSGPASPAERGLPPLRLPHRAADRAVWVRKRAGRPRGVTPAGVPGTGLRRRPRHRRDGGAQDRRRARSSRRPGDRGRRVGRLAGLGSAAGGGPSAGHETDPRAVASDDRGLGADTPQEIPATGWKEIAKRARKELKADQVPLLAGYPSTFCCRVPGDHRRCSISGLVADPHDG